MAVKKQSFLQGAAVLAAAVALVKIIGAVFKIPLGNLIGGTALGHFNVAYSVYNVLLVISTAGLPVAVSKMVAEATAQGRGGDVKKVVRAAMSTFLLIGFAGSLLMFFFADSIAANFMKSPDSALTIKAISPACFCVALMSVFRGYYQGLTNMYPTGISQVIEAACKLGFGLLFAYILSVKGYGPDVTAAGAILGVTIGTLFGAIYLILRRMLDRSGGPSGPASSRTQGAITKMLLAIAIPITIGSGVLALTNFIDSALVLRRLQSAAGFDYDSAVWTYGAYGLSQTMFNFPSAFIVPVSAAIVPAIAAAMARGNSREAASTTESAMRVTSLLALPAAAGLSVLAGPILRLLYPMRLEEAGAATLPLNILAIAVFFNCVVMLSNATLQSLGKVRVPVYTMLCGSVVKIVSNWFLVGTPAININGAPVGTCLCYLTIMLLNMIIIGRSMPLHPLRMFGRPLCASLIMAGAAWASNGLLNRVVSERAAVLGAIIIAVGVYLVLAIVLKAITREDMLMLPKGDKIARLLRLR